MSDERINSKRIDSIALVREQRNGVFALEKAWLDSPRSMFGSSKSSIRAAFSFMDSPSETVKPILSSSRRTCPPSSSSDSGAP